MKICATMPSNIALIKYMGRNEEGQPLNASLSYTLPHLTSRVCIQKQAVNKGESLDLWQALNEKNILPLKLTPLEQKRFLKHFKFLKQKWNIQGVYCIQSGNTFAASCGLASSAASFAALTQATYQLACQRLAQQKPDQQQKLEPEALALLSARASGSSARSFFSPWCVWQAGRAYKPELPDCNLHHECVVVDTSIKKVTSSQAHKRVLSSPHFQGRAQRAEQRLQAVLQALRLGRWKEVFEICCDEFEDLHQLFESSQPAFSYRTAQSQQVLQQVKALWQRHGDGPVATLDAGPNVHLLYRPDCKHRL